MTADRFPAEVAAALTAAGWRPGRRDDDAARDWGLRLAGHTGPSGRRHTVFPALLDALAEFGGVAVEAEGAGEDVAPSGFVIDPDRALHTVDVLAALAARTGTPLAPLGEEGDGVAVLAMDERGRVFALDHAGEWYLGESVEAALATLVLGRRPPRVREGGRWA